MKKRKNQAKAASIISQICSRKFLSQLLLLLRWYIQLWKKITHYFLQLLPLHLCISKNIKIHFSHIHIHLVLFPKVVFLLILKILLTPQCPLIPCNNNNLEIMEIPSKILLPAQHLHLLFPQFPTCLTFSMEVHSQMVDSPFLHLLGIKTCRVLFKNSVLTISKMRLIDKFF